MRSRRILIIAVALLLAGTVFYVVTGLRRGYADFDAVASRQPPMYSTKRLFLADGGSVAHVGRGYRVYALHRMLPVDSGNRPTLGFLGGAKLEWEFPIRIFARDREYYRYIPEQ